MKKTKNKENVMKKFCVMLVLCLLLPACGQPGADIVQNIDYRLENAPENAEITLRFENGKYFGQGPVNHYFGTYILDAKNNMIYFSGVASTRMAGPENLMKAEQEYFAALSAANRIYTTKNKLILLAPGNRKLVYEK